MDKFLFHGIEEFSRTRFSDPVSYLVETDDEEVAARAIRAYREPTASLTAERLTKTHCKVVTDRIP